MTSEAHRLLDEMEHMIVRVRRELRAGEAGDPRWMKVARAELGEKEVPGAVDNPKILEYLASCPNLPDRLAETEETPWCSCFIQWVFTQAGMPGTGKANARSWVEWGNGHTDFCVGAVVVLSRGTNPAHGHVGLYEHGAPKGHVRLLGGNQGNAVSLKDYPMSRVVAIRWPAGEALP